MYVKKKEKQKELIILLLLTEKRTENNFDQFQIIYLYCKIIVYSTHHLIFLFLR